MMVIEMQQHELDTEAFTETYGELRARNHRIIADDRKAGEVSLAKSQMPRSLLENLEKCNASAQRLNYSPLKSQNLMSTDFRHFHDTFSSLISDNQVLDDLSEILFVILSDY